LILGFRANSDIPYIETFDIVNQKYMLEKYAGV
jgi:hypothetical protein